MSCTLLAAIFTTGVPFAPVACSTLKLPLSDWLRTVSVPVPAICRNGPAGTAVGSSVPAANAVIELLNTSASEPVKLTPGRATLTVPLTLPAAPWPLR